MHYQEQVMQMRASGGGHVTGEADLVRRSKVKYSAALIANALRVKFEKAAGMMGSDKRERREAWIMVEKFAGFWICKAHARRYAVYWVRIAWRI